MQDLYPNSRAFRALQPLRLPSGWLIQWNTLYTDDEIESGEIGGSSVFRISHDQRRFVIDVAFRPEFDPSGRYVLEVVYQPWPRDARGRRLSGPISWAGEQEIVHTFETREYAALVCEVEHWIARCSVWEREGH